MKWNKSTRSRVIFIYCITTNSFSRVPRGYMSTRSNFKLSAITKMILSEINDLNCIISDRDQYGTPILDTSTIIVCIWSLQCEKYASRPIDFTLFSSIKTIHTHTKNRGILSYSIRWYEGRGLFTFWPTRRPKNQLKTKTKMFLTQ